MLTIGIDLGTSGIKAVLVEAGADVIATAARRIAVSIPQVGWSEQDPDAWVAAVWACLDDLARDAPAAMAGVAGIGLSGQMLAALILDAGHRPLRPAILWNDQRAGAEAAQLLARCPDIGLRTIGTPDPGLVAPKLMWLARHEPQVMARARMLLLTKDYVRLALTGEIATEPSDAAGTQLLDCRSGAWDPDLCDLAGWRPEHLPPLGESWRAAGGLRAALAARWGMRPGTPVAAGAGDNMGSTLGAGAARPGDAVLTIGTSGVACIVADAFHPGPSRAVLTGAHAVPGMFVSMGVVMSATAALDWVAALGGIDAPTLAARAQTFADTGRIAQAPVMLPCLTGLRTPANRPDAMARIGGLHPGVDLAMIGYAVMEGVAFQFADCVAAQRALGVGPRRVLAVGGGTRSALWLRLIAAALGTSLDLPARADLAGPYGAARLAATAAGAPLDLLTRPQPSAGQVHPDPALADILAARRAAFDTLAP